MGVDGAVGLWFLENGAHGVETTHFDAVGMTSIFASTEPRATAPNQDRRALPPPLRQLIVDLALEYPALRPKELVRICYIASGGAVG
jgi:hypothetical protein